MILVIGYLIAFAAALGYLWTVELRGLLPIWFAEYKLAYTCVLIGGFGGVIYCLRAVYLNRSIRDTWDSRWLAWYFLRPIVSCLVGGVAVVFLKAGLLILDAEQATSASSAGFLALAFIAGLNVDRFLIRIEEIARSTWGIRPSRTSEGSQSQEESPRSSSSGAAR